VYASYVSEMKREFNSCNNMQKKWSIFVRKEAWRKLINTIKETSSALSLPVCTLHLGEIEEKRLGKKE